MRQKNRVHAIDEQKMLKTFTADRQINYNEILAFDYKDSDPLILEALDYDFQTAF
ncbi:MAG: hypothetical protein ACU83N_13535 [Gammaproteobacteria bacterium]